MDDRLDWDASFAIAKALQARFPDCDLEEVSLEMIYQWTIALPEFDDDPALANEEILMDIFRVWLEENLERTGWAGDR